MTFISTHDLAHLVVFPCSVEKGERESRRVGSLVASQGQPTTMHLLKSSTEIATVFVCHRV